MRAFFAKLPLLLAFDLDGTLMPHPRLDLSEQTLAMLQSWRQLGAKIAIITGRDKLPPAVANVVDLDALATSNGGRLLLEGELHREQHFSPTDLREVLAHELEDATVVLFTSEQLYVDLPANMPPREWMIARNYRPMSQAPTQGVLKLGFYHPKASEHAKRLRQSHPHLVLTGAQDPYLNFLTVTPAGADKAAALSLIAEAFGIPLANTVAFGDSDNDQVMLELAGLGVQVGDLPLLRSIVDLSFDNTEQLVEYLYQISIDLQGK